MEVLPQPYHMPATPTPRLNGPRASALCRSAAARVSNPMGAQSLKTRFEAHAVREDLAGDSRFARAKRVEDTELERIDIQAKRKLVVELLLRDCALRHAEAAKGAGGH